ncbi:MAG: deoxyribose-phosphate aldolase [Dysgonamonadaceae bacterium]|jgi:deoxyribose-phosphate aldolase|nr:deoxyribose-phosphate aldolase [Dysgonamonadaceae bacterium]
MKKYEEIFKNYPHPADEEITRKTAEIIAKSRENNRPDVLKFLYSCIDLTSLNTDDSRESIWKFVETVNDFDDLRPDMDNVAAICVYPNFVQTVKEALTVNVGIASVVAGFPAAQTFIEVKIAEAALAVANGADEIDMVLNVGDFLDGNYDELSIEIEEIKNACRDAELKVILETGLLKTSENIRKAAILSMYSGADFLKTSTGKIYPGANPEAVYVICQTVREYYRQHNRKTGVKVSGGVRTVEDALKYYAIVKETLGEEWLTPELFRIGASSLSQNILKVL